MKKYILRNITLLDGTLNMKPTKTSILVNDNKIEKIGNDIEDKEAKVYELDGKYVIPGLINLHVHLPGSGKFSGGNAKKLVKLIVNNKLLNFIGIALGLKYAKVELMSGVTTVRAVGGVEDFDTKARDKINSGKKIGARIFASNYAIATKDGHMVGTVSHEANNVEEVVDMVNDLYNQRVDLIKIMITGGVLDATKLGEPGVLKMPPEFVKAATTKAHELGLKVACHTESYEGIKVALENGVDSIEHGSLIDDYLISLFKKNNACIVETLSPAIPIGLLPESITGYSDFIRYNSNVVLKNMIECIKTAIKNNIQLGLGTDTGCPYVTHYLFYRELDYFCKTIKTTPEYTLYLATLGNAKILGKDNEIGSIEENKLADMLILDSNPLDDFNTLANINTVIKDGIMYKPKIKRIKELDCGIDYLSKLDINEELDKFFNDEGLKQRLGIK